MYLDYIHIISNKVINLIFVSAESAQVFNNNAGSGNAALDALIATAQKEEQPAALEIQEVPTQAPLRLEPQPQRAAAGGRRRTGVPRRRNRPRPQADGEDGEPAPRGRERDRPAPAVGTLDRYSHKNEDGSFTFGYVAADGSFREETRGVDCITRGKYGYIDPDGVKREYSYTSGLPCEIGEDGDQLDGNFEGDNNVIDTVDPSERFRQTQNQQLTEDEIPAVRKEQRDRVRRPISRPRQPAAPAAPADAAFSNFGNSAGLPQRRPVPARPAAGGSALNNLLTIAEEGPSAVAAAPAPTRRPVPARIPIRASPRPAAPVNPGQFDFDAELEGFTLNRPSLTFEQNRAQEETGNGASFQSQLVFDENTGTFQTELQQNIVGGSQINQVNPAAPFRFTTAAPATTIELKTTAAAAEPTRRPTTVQATRLPAPTTAVPSSRPAAVVPAGTLKLDFEPLNIPKPAPAAPSPAPAAPTTFAASPSPATVRLPSPTPAAPVVTRPQAASPTGAAPANTFFVFNPFNQQGAPAPSPVPASEPFKTPLNQNAFAIRPVVPGQAAPAAQAPRPAAPQAAPAQPTIVRQPPQFSIQPQLIQQQPRPATAARPAAPPAFQPQVFRPAPGQPQPVQSFRPAPAAPRPAPAAARPAPAAARPAPAAARPAPAAARPVQPAPAARPQSAPQLQFGFTPVQQQQPNNRPAPFTAFRTGTPPQIQALQQGRPAQLGVPPQLQGSAQRFAPQLIQGRPGTPQLRPAQFQQATSGSSPQPFSVFGGQLRGA